MTVVEDTLAEIAPADRLSAGALLRKHAALLVTMALFAGGLYALYRLLAPLDLAQVIVAMRATEPHVLALAIASTAVSYMALIGYDWSATRYIGKPVPLASVALGGFLGYAIGNTIGISALSGGAVRYRIYAALGLDGYDVAAISSFAAIACGIGATIIGLGALAVHPGALEGITTIDPALMRIGAIAGLVLTLGIVVLMAVRGSRLRLGRFMLRAPGLVDVARQLVFTFVDILTAALALYILLPSGALPFSTFLAVFSIALMIGVASHVPGGVGVFEGVVIAALPASVALSEAVTGLLLFRLIYFLLPFLLALALLSLTEAWTASTRAGPVIARLSPIVRAGQSVVPLAMGTLVLGSSLYMMFASVLRAPDIIAGDTLPLVLIESGAMLSSILGSVLVVLATGIYRRSHAAFWLVFVALGVGMVTAYLHARDIDRAVILGAMALLLWPCRREFYRAARLTEGVLSVRWILFVLAALGSAGVMLYVVHETAPFSSSMWWQFGLEAQGPRAQRAAVLASVTLTLALLVAALRVRTPQSQPPDAVTLARAHAIIDAEGTATEMLAVTGDKRLMFSEDGRAVISYGVRGASWIALGAPVGARAAREDLAWSFHDAARAAGARPVFYETPAEFMIQSAEMGLTAHKMGEEAVVRLDIFTLDGPARKKLRTTYNRALRDGLTFEISAPPHSIALIAELRCVSDAWVATRRGREKRFSVGRFDPDYLARFPIGVVRSGGRVAAFANLLTAEARHSAAIDLMRHGTDAPPNATEFLFVSLMMHLSAQGYREISLGMAPMAGLNPRRGADLLNRFGSLIYRHGDRFYSFEGLWRFKAKFDPEWRPRYLCCRSILPPIAPLADAALLIAGPPRRSAAPVPPEIAPEAFAPVTERVRKSGARGRNA